MLIVCPSCATSYMIDQASVGPAGRTVRCARCKATWFAGAPEPAPKIVPGHETRTASDVTAFVDGVIAEAESRAGGIARQADGPPQARDSAASGDDFGEHDGEPPDFAERPDANDPATGADPARQTMPRAEPFAPAFDGEAPERISDAPSLVPPIEHEALPVGAAASEPEDIESFVARRERLQARRRNARRSSRWIALLLVLLAFNVAVVGARDEVVRYLPQTASLFAAIRLPVNLRHLRFENVRIAKETVDGAPVLIVQGTIVCDADKPTKVPRLRFAARNMAKQEVYTWTMLPSRSILQPGESFEFRSRLGSPPKDARDVMVRFFTVKDAESIAK